MKKYLLVLLVLSGSLSLAAQEPYNNPAISHAERAADLLSRMTLEEKISQMLNGSPAIERLGIPPTDWWNEALHGVARAGKATVFPQAIGLAATFDDEAVLETFSMISDEARAKHHYFKSRGQYKRYQGLTFWTPNINIYRDPRWGRGQETYGEDPFLTERMGVAAVYGLQGDMSGKYNKAHACAKHYAVHSGPEWNRHSFDAKNISRRDLWETYLPAFRTLVVDAGVKEVMCAYNRFEGEPCCSSDELLMRILRQEWGFEGVVVSDCGAIDDFFTKSKHGTHESASEASADAVLAGTDLNCGNTYHTLGEAVEKGLITEQQIDVSVLRLLTARFELGMFDPDDEVAWSNIPYSVVESEGHVEKALEMARKSIVLLENKNDVLPLKKSGTIAVVGPNAADSVMLWANYNGTPTRSVTILDGIRSRLPEGNVIYNKGCEYVEHRVFESRIDKCSFGGEQGFRALFWNNTEMSGEPAVETRVKGAFNFDNGGNTVFAPGVELTDFSARFEGTLMPDATEEIVMRFVADDGYRIYLDGREVVSQWNTSRKAPKEYAFQAQNGVPVDIVIEYFQGERNAYLRFDMGIAREMDYAGVAAEVAGADAIVFVGGFSARIEGEQMSVELPGFKGGDRTRIELPDVQRKLLAELKKTGKPVILVLCSGSSVALRWESENLDAILAAWYPGQQGGTAVADVLFGDYNPAGRLPLTFYASTYDLPDYEDYSMQGRTYRYFEGQALYPFGYGLSYTDFALSKARIADFGDEAVFSATVKNTGKRAGDEVVQVYIRNPRDPEGPAKSLRGFSRVTLRAGEKRRVEIVLPRRAFEFFNPASSRMAIVPGTYEILYGSSSDGRDLKTLTYTLK